MDLEFHYYINYLVALKAGFNLNQSYKIAYSSQYVDNNTEEIIVYNSDNKPFKSVLTQDYLPFLNKSKAEQTYLCFHFIPGEEEEAAYNRKDGKKHHFATTPGSSMARELLQSALTSCNVYKIGIASHAFADTWAHANFVGLQDDFNNSNSLLGFIIPSIGHADYLEKPDRVDEVWYDNRLKIPIVDNKEKVITAAKELFKAYYKHLSHKLQSIEESIEELSLDLSMAIGTRGECSYRERVTNYHRLALKYSGRKITPYNQEVWKNMAYIKTVRGYRWKANYLKSDWYLFQKAAKAYKKYVWKLILKRTNCYQKLTIH